MKLQDKIDEIKNNSNNIACFVTYTKIEGNTRVAVIEYWNQVGNTDEVIGYCKKFIILNFKKENETILEDKATINQVVRARGW